MDVLDLITEFESIVDNIYGIYLDGTSGFRLVLVETINRDTELLNGLLKGCSTEELDSRNIYYGKGNPNSNNAKPLHKVTRGDLKKRNVDNGHNYQFLANLCVTSIYQYWDDHYRNQLAKLVGVEPSSIKIPIFGDLRRMRRSIIHHRSIALKDIEKCEILKWHSEGDKIYINRDRMEFIVDEVKAAIKWLKNEWV